MSSLIFQHKNNQCIGWANPSISLKPRIDTLSSFYSPAASNSLVVIYGANFYSYSSVKFSSFTPAVFFINSGQLEFYVPASLTTGIYPIQVYNSSLSSNSVNYTIDNASGFWVINSHGVISNSNMSNTTGAEGGITVNGNMLTNGNNTSTNFLNIADRRIMNILEPLINIDDPTSVKYSVDNLNPVKFLNTQSNSIEFGFIADEVQIVYPFLVSGTPIGVPMQTLNYNCIIALLVKEIQQLKQDVRLLQTKLP